MLDPERVDGAQQDGPLDQRPGLLAELLLARLELARGVVGDVVDDVLAAAQLIERVGAELLALQAQRGQRLGQAVEVPVGLDLAEVRVDDAARAPARRRPARSR